jgi:hypothetical protein
MPPPGNPAWQALISQSTLRIWQTPFRAWGVGIGGTGNGGTGFDLKFSRLCTNPAIPCECDDAFGAAAYAGAATDAEAMLMAATAAKALYITYSIYR